MLTCAKCGESKPAEAFISDKRRHSGRGSYCRECHKLFPSMKRLERGFANCKVCGSAITHGRSDRQYCSDRCGHRYRSRKYALAKLDFTADQYYDLLAEQGFVCAICGQGEEIVVEGEPRTLCLDHCHETNKARAILCHRCNSGLGLFRDDPGLLAKASAYLEEFASRTD